MAYKGETKMQTSIIVKTQFVAYHCWPDCPYKEVAFLKNRHRHVFFVEVKIPTTEDRQLEFFMVKTKLNNFLFGEYMESDLGSMSCESIAKEIARYLSSYYEIPNVSVKVFEDDENGAEVIL
jgi:hypothetical protein